MPAMFVPAVMEAVPPEVLAPAIRSHQARRQSQASGIEREIGGCRGAGHCGSKPASDRGGDPTLDHDSGRVSMGYPVPEFIDRRGIVRHADRT
jgi:hypothetical protein